jgi:hypothetical protein
MGNIRNFHYNNLDIRRSNSDYWDFYLNSDETCLPVYNGFVTGDCLVAHFDFNDSDIYASQGIDFGDTIYSLTTWGDAVNSGVTLNNIGLTGIDNGLITFVKTSADTTNQSLLSALTASTIVIPSGDTRLCLNRVTGMTGNYSYPINFKTETQFPSVGDYAELCGGFYQGYYKLDGYNYQVLPDRVPKGWVAELWLKKDDTACSGVTATTLNDVYPENKGFFLYFGSRAENKFWNIFDGANTGCTSACTTPTSACTGVTEFCTVPKETDISISGDSVIIPLSPPPIDIKVVDNQFLIYHRGGGSCGSCNSSSCNCTTPTGVKKGGTGLKGKLACDFSGGSIIVTAITTTITDDRNQFLVYHRGSGKNTGGSHKGTDGEKGKVACSYSGDSQPLLELDVNADVVDNAIGFRIKDDGSIGYRLLTVTGVCSGDTFVTGATIEEEYSASGCVKDNEWTHVAIRFVADTTYDECQLQEKGGRKGKLYFYVNCKLKFVVDDFDEFIAKRLVEHSEKQLGVPYNISLGGGSQGLLESMTFDGQDPEDQGLLIEENFAGSFIGGVSQFRFYICELDYCQLKNNCDQEENRYNDGDSCFLLQENGDFVLQQDSFKIIIDKDTNFLLQENDSFILMENGFKIKWLP